LGGILGLELAPLSVLSHSWHSFLPVGSPLIVFCGALFFFGRHKFHADDPQPRGVDLRFVAFHLLALALLAFSEFHLLYPGAGRSSAPAIMSWVWYGSIPLMIAALVAALFPGAAFKRLLSGFGSAWVYAALTMLAVASYKQVVVLAWDIPGSRLGQTMQIATFDGVRSVLGLFYSGVVPVPSTLELGTSRFQVTVGGNCSGIEGVGLMLALTIGWLIFARRELRLRRALLLVPAALAMIWLLNLVRIAALIAIGDEGHGDVAIYGFHSQAGWLLFNAVALGFLLTAQHLRWLHKDSFAPAPLASAQQRNVAAIYLLPFMAVLTASLIGRAVSSGFDWLYPLRPAVAVAMLWVFRADYRRLDWRFGWLGPLAGAAVFALWLGMSRRHGGTDELGMQLARLAPWQRTGWIAMRALAAVATVPIIEELAFRGYIARRVMSADVEAVPFSRLGILAIAVSAALFGALHGNMWIAGTIAGAVFALVAKLRGRLGEAVAAHATANLLIAAWVLVHGEYRMW
jgi:exosortase E/protease (VPEID-CTERM system)